MSSYTYHGTRDLIAMPGRSVQTFPSGLVRVERSFMCRKGDVARYRNILRVNEPMPFDDGAPAIDGLYIFPEVQEQVRDDGFVEFRVTAYGRSTIEPYVQVFSVSGQLIVAVSTTEIVPSPFGGFEDQVTVTFETAPSVNDMLQCKIVLPASTTRIAFNAPPSGYIPSGEPLPGVPINGQIEPLRFYLSNLSSVNFGLWSEWSYSYNSR